MFIYDISKVPANKRKLQSRQKYSLKNEEYINIKWYGHKVEDSFYTDTDIYIYMRYAYII